MKGVALALTVVGGVAALCSAYLWLKASRVQVPSLLNDSPRNGGSFADALTMQSRLNARAAICAAIAALCWGLASMMQLFPGSEWAG